MSPGPIFEGEDHGEDPYGAKAAFGAAGFVCGDVVLNCFSYHLTPGAFIMESGAHALGCAVIPAGPGNTEQTLAAVAHLKPNGYAGPPDFLKILLDKAGGETSLRKALVSGAALPPSLRAEMEARGVELAAGFRDRRTRRRRLRGRRPAPGLKVADDVLVEIVRPGSGDPLPLGAVGEIVVTALRGGYPLLRFATGDLSAFLDETRIRGWMGRADQTTKVKGMFVHPSAVIEAAKRHPELAAVRLVVRREGEQDTMTLLAETAAPSPALAEAVAASLQATTKLRGARGVGRAGLAAQRRQNDRRRAAGSASAARNGRRRRIALARKQSRKPGRVRLARRAPRRGGCRRHEQHVEPLPPGAADIGAKAVADGEHPLGFGRAPARGGQRRRVDRRMGLAGVDRSRRRAPHSPAPARPRNRPARRRDG